jgi:hypothetical protein
MGDLFLAAEMGVAAASTAFKDQICSGKNTGVLPIRRVWGGVLLSDFGRETEAF